MPDVEFDTPPGSAPAVAKFCETVLETNATVDQPEGQPSAKVAAGEGQSLICHEVDAPVPTYDGHHIAGYLANFSRPHQRLLKRNLISEESNQHQFRFFDIVKLSNNQSLFQIEHEVRSMTHPLYAREQINRNSAITNGIYAPGHYDFA